MINSSATRFAPLGQQAIYDARSSQKSITRVCAAIALLLLKNGAESNLIIDNTRRLGLALGAEKIECLLTANGIIVTSIVNGHSVTTTRRCHSQGVNYSVILQIQRWVIDMEKDGFKTEAVYQQWHHFHHKRYNRLFTAIMVALSCACLAHLSGGNVVIMLTTFVAAFIGMRVRQWLQKKHFNYFIEFMGTAFAATLVTSAAFHFDLGNKPHIAIASAVLLLVPGVPLINAVSDLLKGHTNMGIGRWVIATIMSLAVCLGMALAMSVMHIQLEGVF